MAKRCEICGKTIAFGIQLSHSHIRTKRTWTPNLQRVKAVVGGRTKRIRVCTQCLRSGKVKRAL
jgi:large subunit ribosomal protein L28